MRAIETQKNQIFVDDEDFELLSQFTWTRDAKGYAMRKMKVDGRQVTIYLHRFLMGLGAGDGVVVDHIDGDKSNNTRGNLRICSNSQNLMNRGKQKNNTSGFKGVCWHKGAGRWSANIHVGGKAKYLGLFDSPDDAHKAYCDAADRLHGEFANKGEA